MIDGSNYGQKSHWLHKKSTYKLQMHPTTYNSIVDYLTSYGFMVALLILCVTACYLIHICPKEKYSSREQMHLSDEENAEELTSTAGGQ